MGVGRWLKSNAVVFILSVFLAVVPYWTAGPARAQDAGTLALPCTLVAGSPPSVQVATSPARGFRFDLLDKNNVLLGRQLVFFNGGGDTLLSEEAWKLNGNSMPEVKCSLDSQTSTWHSGVVVDNGPVISLNDMYIGRGSVTVSYYVRWEDYLESRNDIGLTNELFWTKVDAGKPQQDRVTAKPGKTVVATIEGVTPGKHQLSIGQENIEGSPVWTVDFEMPDFSQSHK